MKNQVEGPCTSKLYHHKSHGLSEFKAELKSRFNGYPINKRLKTVSRVKNTQLEPVLMP